MLLNFLGHLVPALPAGTDPRAEGLSSTVSPAATVFLPISRGEKREDVAAFREKMGYTFPMGLDPSQAIYDRYASNYIPRNF